MDDFERKLSVALKTAADGLPVEVATRAQREIAVAPVPPHRHRSRVLLAAAVVIALLAAVGGTWWAVDGTRNRQAPPADPSCSSSDLRFSRQAPTAGEGEVLTVIAVTARSACVLAQPPAVTFRGQDVPWHSQHGAEWAAPSLAADATVRFALSTLPGLRGAVCDGVAATSRTVEVRVAGNQPPALSFDLGEAVCGVVSLTLYGPGATAGPPCVVADMSLARLGNPPPGDVTVLGLVGLTVSRPCTLSSPPTMTTADGEVLPFEATPADPDDDGSWQPRSLEAGTTVRFAVEQLPVTSGNPCAGPVVDADLAVTIGSAVGGVSLPVDYGLCGGQLAVTTYEATTACTASEVQVVPRDIGQLGGAVGIDVVALQPCTLDAAPAVTVGASDPSSRAFTVPFAGSRDRASAPWSSVTLARGQSTRFEVVLRNVAVSCPPSGVALRVGTSIGGEQLLSFGWLAHDCGLDLYVLTFYGPPAADTPCTADDVDIRPVVDPSAVHLAVSSHDGAHCTLVDPPTVLVDGSLATFWSSADPSQARTWTPVVVEPGRELDLGLVATETGAGCPPAGRTVDVSVGVAEASVATLEWRAQLCDGGLLVTVPE